jgi:hypothetical protein
MLCLIECHDLTENTGVVTLLHSFSTSALDVSGQLRTAVVLPPGKHPPVPTGNEVEEARRHRQSGRFAD